MRRIGGIRAGAIGVSAMLGAGVFAVWGPAVRSSGDLLLVALALAAVVAALNALSVAQLGMAHPVAGGVYAYGRAAVAPWFGAVAGGLFLIGKTCSIAAMALVIGAAVHPAAAPWLAIAALVALWLLDVSGIRSTALVAMIVAVVVFVGLGVLVVLRWTGVGIGDADAVAGLPASAPLGVVQGAALLFFAFAGYARMATLGEEVRAPRRTLPRAILGALVLVLVVYGVIAVTLLHSPGLARVAAEPMPLAADLGAPGAAVVGVLAVLAAAGALLGLVAGLGRTGFAMARDGLLPGVLTRLAPTGVPAIAEAVPVLVAAALVVWAPTDVLIAVSSAAVLGYYALGHIAAIRQGARSPEERWLPSVVPWAGLLGCAALAVSLLLPRG